MKFQNSSSMLCCRLWSICGGTACTERSVWQVFLFPMIRNKNILDIRQTSRVGKMWHLSPFHLGLGLFLMPFFFPFSLICGRICITRITRGECWRMLDLHGVSTVFRISAIRLMVFPIIVWNKIDSVVMLMRIATATLLWHRPINMYIAIHKNHPIIPGQVLERQARFGFCWR